MPEIKNTDKENRKINGKKAVIIALSSACVILAIIVIAVINLRSRPAIDDTTKYLFDKAAKEGRLTDDFLSSEAEAEDFLNSMLREGMFNVSINSEIVFENGKASGAIGFENISENRYYSRLKLTRNDTGELLYESDGIKPGQYIDNIELKKNLQKGEYPCTATVTATDPESLEDIGEVTVAVTVVVEN